MALMTGYGVSGADHDFYAYAADGEATIVAAVEGDAIGGESRYTATMPAGTVRYELRYRGVDAAGSYMAWEQAVWASQASVDGVRASIASAGGVEVVSPVMAGGRIVVTRGFDYAGDGGSQSIVISETEPGSWGSDLLTADSFRLYARHDTERKIDFDIDAVTLSEADGLRSFSFDLLRSTAPRSGAYTYWVYGRWEPAERETPVIRGTIVIERGRIVATP